MAVDTRTYATTVVTWACDRTGCGAVDAQVNPSAAERLYGPDGGWRRLRDGSVECPEHAL